MFNIREIASISKKFSGNLIVQYNIWLKGNKKLKKKIVKQNKNAKIDFFPDNAIFSFCLKPPFELKWYLAFFLEKFSNIKHANINISKKKDNLFEKAKSSNVIQEL